MKSYSSRSGTTFLWILIPLFVASACQPLPQAAASTTPGAGEKTFQASVVLGSGTYNLPDTTTGLADLSSYKATLTLSFDGTKAGQPDKWSKTYVMLARKDPAARQVTVDQTGDLPDLQAVFMAELNGADYDRRGDNACNATVTDPANSLAAQMEPASFLGTVIGADAAASGTVNGAAADHYTFDQRALGQAAGATSKGEMWVASKGGYIVKYLLTTQGTTDYFGNGVEGTLTWDYELTGVNKPVVIQLPADCPAGMVNAPELPDASNILNVPSLLSYDTASSLAAAAAFYQKQLPGLAWKPLGKPAIADTTALLIFTQGDQDLTVEITTAAAGTNVQISLDSAQP